MKNIKKTLLLLLFVFSSQLRLFTNRHIYTIRMFGGLGTQNETFAIHGPHILHTSNIYPHKFTIKFVIHRL